MIEHYHLRETAHGRGLITTRTIPKDSLIHICDAPYASVIQRDFRKEVCGMCFAYSFEIRRCTWNVRSATGHGIWFCGDACRDIWETQENVDGIFGLINSAMEKAIVKMKKMNRSKETEDTPNDPGRHNISRTELGKLWKIAEVSKPKHTDVIHLNDTELDIARLVAEVIARRYVEDNSPQNAIRIQCHWSEYLELQESELLHIHVRPNTIDTHIRVFLFLRDALPVVLRVYLVSSDTVRATLARVSSNAFGIWQLSPATDSGEMLGWGMYVSAAYFNHNCDPNVRKLRVGRAIKFYATRDIEEGEELCISYVSVEDSVEERRRSLQENWHFRCECARCQKESDDESRE